jgi:hypothetical protein
MDVEIDVSAETYGRIGATVDLGAGLRPRPSAHQHRLLNAADGSGLIEQGAHRRADAVWPVIGLRPDADPFAVGNPVSLLCGGKSDPAGRPAGFTDYRISVTRYFAGTPSALS